MSLIAYVSGGIQIKKLNQYSGCNPTSYINAWNAEDATYWDLSGKYYMLDRHFLVVGVFWLTVLDYAMKDKLGYE